MGQGIELRNTQVIGEVFPFELGGANEHTVQMLLLEGDPESSDYNI